MSQTQLDVRHKGLLCKTPGDGYWEEVHAPSKQVRPLSAFYRFIKPHYQNSDSYCSATQNKNTLPSRLLPSRPTLPQSKLQVDERVPRIRIGTRLRSSTWCYWRHCRPPQRPLSRNAVVKLTLTLRRLSWCQQFAEVGFTGTLQRGLWAGHIVDGGQNSWQNEIP